MILHGLKRDFLIKSDFTRVKMKINFKIMKKYPKIYEKFVIKTHYIQSVELKNVEIVITKRFPVLLKWGRKKNFFFWKIIFKKIFFKKN